MSNVLSKMNNINDNIDTINEISFINTVINEEKNIKYTQFISTYNST
jgi:hypothetical protein